jgi:hypothetical protein
MTESAIEIARKFLASDGDGLVDLRIYQFKHDGEAHDDDAIDRLYAQFISDFERVQSKLSGIYGEPFKTGIDDDDVIPLCGVFRFAVWEIDGRVLYAAAAHEDRGCPILLILGAVSL